MFRQFAFVLLVGATLVAVAGRASSCPARHPGGEYAAVPQAVVDGAFTLRKMPPDDPKPPRPKFDGRTHGSPLASLKIG